MEEVVKGWSGDTKKVIEPFHKEGNCPPDRVPKAEHKREVSQQSCEAEVPPVDRSQ
jgi:hypothetical protein